MNYVYNDRVLQVRLKIIKDSGIYLENNQKFDWLISHLILIK